MTSLPAHCPKCRSIFPFKAIELGTGATLSLKNLATNCPVCGYENAVVSDGVYRASNEAVELISGSEFTRFMLEALNDISLKAAVGEISKQEAISRAETISPAYARLIERFATFGLPALALLVAIVQTYLQIEGNSSSDRAAEKLLSVVTEQTFTLKKIEHELKQDRAKRSKSKRGRRSEVKREKRKNLKQRWSEMGRSRTR